MIQRRGIWRIVALTTVAATSVAACGSSKSTTASPGKCSNISIAFFGALTGSSANLGINEDNGTKLAVKQFNSANPNCQVKVTDYDSQGDPAQAPALATKAVGDTSVVGIVGPAFSGESKAANPTFNEAGLPTITPSATNTSLSESNWKIFHRAVATDAAQGAAVVSYLQNDVKSTKVAVIDDGSSYGQGLAGIVKNKMGPSVVTTDTIDPKGTDFSSTVTKAKSAGATAVFFGGYYQAAGVLAKQLHDGGVTAQFISGDGSEDPGFVKAAGNAAAEGAVLTAPAAPLNVVPGGDQFTSAYQSAFNTAPGLYSAEAFDAANILLKAIGAGNTTRASILNYLGSVDYKGLTKTYKFSGTGELSGTVTVYAYQVKNGEIVGLKAINT